MNSGLIPGGQNLSKRQTVFFTPVDPMNKEHKDPEDSRSESTASCMVQAESLEETSKHGVLGRHQILLKRKDLSSIRRDRTPSSFTIHSQPIVSRKLFKMEAGEIMYEKVFASPRPPPTDFL